MRRKFDRGFKAEAVKQVRVHGMSRQQVCQDLGLGKSTLDKWLSEKQDLQGTDAPLSESERAELKRLRKELATVKMERDFLKKASAYFAKN